MAFSVWANKTPSDVFFVSEQIVFEVQHLRTKMGIEGTSRIPEVQVHKTPLHVYAKSLEVLDKLAKIQYSNGALNQPVNNIPLIKITPSNVFKQVELILDQIHSIQSSKKTGSTIKKAQFVDGKTPSNVYENLWKASFMLDALVKEITPTDVYNNMQKASDELVFVTSQLKLTPILNMPKTDVRTKPSQVLLQGYLNLHGSTLTYCSTLVKRPVVNA